MTDPTIIATRGLLISFEGLDGSGKTTQIDLLGRWLEGKGVPYILTREPGGTPLGTELRHLVLNRTDLALVPLAEAFMFQADRAQHFATLVLPALEKGTLVITDRCLDSSIAYQGAARGLGIELIEQLSLLATGGYLPDVTILLDLDPYQVGTRTRSTNDQRTNDQRVGTGLASVMREEQTHFDKQSLEFHKRLRQAFLALAQAHPERIKVIDASRSIEQVHQDVIVLVEEAFRRARTSA